MSCIMEKENPPNNESDCELLEVPQEYEVIDLTGDDVCVEQVTFPTPFLNHLGSCALINLETILQLQMHLKNIVINEEESKEKNENVSLEVQRPLKTSLQNVKSKEQNIKPSVLRSTSTDENFSLASGCTGEKMAIRKAGDQSSLNSVESRDNLISEDFQRETIKTTVIPFPTTDKNLESESHKYHVPSLQFKQPVPSKFCVDKSIRLENSVSLNSKFPRNAGFPKHCTPRAKRSIGDHDLESVLASCSKKPKQMNVRFDECVSVMGVPEIGKLSGKDSKKLSFEEYKLRKGISLLGPLKKVDSPLTQIARSRGATPITSENGLTAAQTH